MLLLDTLDQTKGTDIKAEKFDLVKVELGSNNY